uniref:Uncharacterized protein n=1 Tax=Candidatus Kentrum sp. DK TaxID=2126562 RepID=A0A450SCI3_9GAMM|nr:MAG: hypothetical protein BECKDK2373C_GA0170839_102730 [Candidatus Kentron sp. DK]
MEHELLNVHQETEKNIPRAEKNPVLWRFLVWGLPGEALTFASIVVFAIVSVVSLWSSAQRQLLAFPFERLVTVGILSVIFLFALWLVVVVSRRPGKLWPRLWAFLSMVLPGVLIAGFLLVEFRLLETVWTPLLSALSLASFSSLAVLYLRRLPLGPDSRWLRPIGPLALVVGIAMGSAGAWQFSEQAFTIQQERIDTYLAKLDGMRQEQRTTERETLFEEALPMDGERMVIPPPPRLDDIGPDPDLRRISKVLGRESELDTKLRDVMSGAVRGRAMMIADTTGTLAAIREHDWNSVETRPREARLQIEALGRLDPRVIGEPHLWQDAAALGFDQPLIESYRSLLKETALAFALNHLPRLSELTGPQIWWDPDRDRWIENRRFEETASITADYLRQLGRFWMAIRPPAIDRLPDGWTVLRREHHQFTTRIREQLAVLENSWENRWSLGVFPREIQPPPPMDLASFLNIPLIPVDQDRIAPANLGRLLRAKLGTVRERAKNDDRCAYQDYEYEKRKGRPRLYHRLDCSAYRAGNNGKPNRLWFQYRLVYQSSGRKPSENDLPTEIYLLFPLQAGEKTDAFTDAVMQDLARAVEENLIRGWYIKTGMSGSYAEGFQLIDENQHAKVAVYRPRRIKLKGLNQLDALEVRAQRK